MKQKKSGRQAVAQSERPAKSTRRSQSPDRLNGVACEITLYNHLVEAGWSGRKATAMDLAKGSTKSGSTRHPLAEVGPAPGRSIRAEKPRMFVSMRFDNSFRLKKIDGALEQYRWPAAAQEPVKCSAHFGATDGLSPQQRLNAIAEILATIALRAAKKREEQKDHATS
jgi:hypothetical protein